MSSDLPSSPMADNKENIDLVEGSEGETVAVKARMRKVKATLLSLGMNVKENCNPPVIAVLGSGGGPRAMVGFLGTISKLAELDLLGTVTFISAISGSTWCMSSLYANSNWSDYSYMKDLEIWFCERIKLETDRKWRKPWAKIKEKFLGDSYSLTDLWAYTFVFYIVNKLNEEKLSNHKVICEFGEDPYPIYSAVRMDEMHEGKSEAWFEFTPHKSGFPAYEGYIKTEHLGCSFRGGHLLEQQPEHDLLYLQGLWGSSPAVNWVWLAIHELYKKVKKTATGVKDGGVGVFKSTWRRVQNWATAEKRDITFLIPLIPRTDIIPLIPIIPAMVLPGKSWSEFIRGVYENAKVVKNIAYCFLKWQWGTMNNFLYECKYKIPEGSDLFHKKRIHLVDAGLEINTPYPLVLPPHRKVDLILSFDFSEEDPFETLKRTAEYCKDHQISFPVNTEESYEYPPTKSCYVFEGDGHETPDVMHFPLFNVQTCGEAEKIPTLKKKYATRVPSYDTSMMNELLDIAKKNVESNLEEIKVKIQQCVWRSNKRERS